MKGHARRASAVLAEVCALARAYALAALCSVAGACTLGVGAAEAAVSVPPSGERRALLIGVNDYDEGCPRAQMPNDCRSNNLYGPSHDVESLKDTLQRYWGFRAQDITTLTNAGAKRADILAALLRLEAWAKPGNLAVIYFSGHGTSPQNAHDRSNWPAADTGALVVAPDDLAHPRISYLVGRTDIRPVLEHMDAKGTEVFAAFDACFSQNSARSAQAHTRAYRDLGLGSQLPSELSSATPALPSADDSPYRRVFYMSAAGAAEPALEIGPDRTYDGQVHGAFTDALLRVLTGRRSAHSESHTGFMSYDELADAVEDFMRPRDYGHTPVRMPGKYAAARAVAEQPAFAWVQGAPATASASVQAAAAAEAGVRVRLDSSADFLRASLQSLPGIALIGGRDTDAEYVVRAAYPGTQQVVVMTPGNEPIFGAGGLEGAYTQNPRDAVQSLLLRASLRRLYKVAESKRGSLSLQAGFTDASIGETLTAATPASLFAQVSAPAQALVLHLMGDGSTRIWLAANTRNPECMQGAELPPGKNQVLCRWGGAEAPYGLDLLYVIAFAPAIPRELAAVGGTFDAVFVDRVTAAVNAAPRSASVREIRFFTVPKKYN